MTGLFVHRSEEKAVAAIADPLRKFPLRKFWAPRMRSAISQHLDSGGASLYPVVLKQQWRLCGRRPPLSKGLALRRLRLERVKGIEPSS